ILKNVRDTETARRRIAQLESSLFEQRNTPGLDRKALLLDAQLVGKLKRELNAGYDAEDFDAGRVKKALTDINDPKKGVDTLGDIAKRYGITLDDRPTPIGPIKRFELTDEVKRAGAADQERTAGFARGFAQSQGMVSRDYTSVPTNAPPKGLQLLEAPDKSRTVAVTRPAA